jgi:osmotically inducible protein OsmC
MEAVYKTTAVSTGGRNGSVLVENSPLKFEMSPPKEMGGTGGGVNPEQLFAAGYSACFGSAVQHVIRSKRLAIALPEIRLTVGIGKNDAGNYQLEVEITTSFTGIGQETADSIVREAHMICPYSHATRGNIDVSVAAIIK